MDKRFSQACENNKRPILEQLVKHFAQCRKVFEIGAGTGQHAVYFADNLPHLIWQSSDQPENHSSIRAWIDETPRVNLPAPLAFTIGTDAWPCPSADGVFTANTAHIMQPLETRLMMSMIAEQLPAEGVFCQYGPFNLDGEYTSESNRQFDTQLRSEGYGGVRDLAELQTWAKGMTLTEQVTMPANNLFLVWRKNKIG